AWAYGAQGERALGGLLNRLRDDGMSVLHDRRIPSSRANIDHIVVGPAGVFVVDAKNYKGRVERRARGGFFSTDYRLFVGGRDNTALIAGMTKRHTRCELRSGTRTPRAYLQNDLFRFCRLVAVRTADRDGR